MWKISLLLGAFALSGNVAAASFDCQKAKSELEHVLCDNAELSLLDSRLGGTYNTLTKMLNSAEVKQLRAAQTAWLGTRITECTAKSVDCLKRLYQKRIDTLSFRALPEYKTSAAGKVAGTYKKGKNMDLSVEALSANSIAVAMLGAGEGGRWTCDFSAEGELKNGSAKLHVLDDEEVNFRFEKNQIIVSEETNHNSACGVGGTLKGIYTRVTN